MKGQECFTPKTGSLVSQSQTGSIPTPASLLKSLLSTQSQSHSQSLQSHHKLMMSQKIQIQQLQQKLQAFYSEQLESMNLKTELMGLQKKLEQKDKIMERLKTDLSDMRSERDFNINHKSQIAEKCKFDLQNEIAALKEKMEVLSVEN